MKVFTNGFHSQMNTIAHLTIAHLLNVKGHQRTPRRHWNGYHQPLYSGGPQQAPWRGPPAGTHALRLGQTPAADLGSDQPAEKTPRALWRGAGGGCQEDLRSPCDPVRLQPLLQVPRDKHSIELAQLVKENTVLCMYLPTTWFLLFLYISVLFNKCEI